MRRLLLCVAMLLVGCEPDDGVRGTATFSAASERHFPVRFARAERWPSQIVVQLTSSSATRCWQGRGPQETYDEIFIHLPVTEGAPTSWSVDTLLYLRNVAVGLSVVSTAPDRAEGRVTATATETGVRGSFAVTLVPGLGAPTLSGLTEGTFDAPFCPPLHGGH